MRLYPAFLVAAALVSNACTPHVSLNKDGANNPAAPAPMPKVPADQVPVAKGSSSKNLPLEHDATASDLAELTGKELKLTKLVSANKVQSLPSKGKPITMQLLEEGHVAGQGPVNRYSGDLHLTEGGQCAWVRPLASTRMAGPPAAMDLENQFLSTLGSATHLMRAGDGLRFETADKSGAVEFHPGQ